MRVKPEITPENAAFWSGGKNGQLMIAMCEDCSAAIHPPQIICPACHSRDVSAQPVAGSGTIYSYTINHHPWLPDMQVPFAIAVVDVDGAAGVRVTGQLRTDDLDTIQIGQKVIVDFDPVDEDIFIPFWRADTEGRT